MLFKMTLLLCLSFVEPYDHHLVEQGTPAGLR